MEMHMISQFEKRLFSPIESADDYFACVKALYDEWSDCTGQEWLYERTCEKLERSIPDLVTRQPPQFFTGDINAEMAMISLNPHINDNVEIDTIPFCGSWKEYRDFWTDFPRRRYGKNGGAANPNIGLSKFDRRVQHFLSGSDREVTADDLAKWNMFHVELFPIGSEDFKSVRAGAIDDYACAYIICMLQALALAKRKLILVLNAQLRKFLRRAAQLKLLDGLEIVGKRSFSIGRKKVFREDYDVRLMPGQNLKIAAATTFAKKGYLSNAELAEYSKAIFSPEEIKVIKSAVGSDLR